MGWVRVEPKICPRGYFKKSKNRKWKDRVALTGLHAFFYLTKRFIFFSSIQSQECAIQARRATRGLRSFRFVKFSRKENNKKIGRVILRALSLTPFRGCVIFQTFRFYSVGSDGQKNSFNLFFSLQKSVPSS